MSIYEKLRGIGRSGIRELFDMAQEAEDLISLGIGEPDFDTPEIIKEAAKKAVDKGYTHYTPNIGREDLREEIVKKLKRENEIDIGVENVMITIGANQAFLLALSTFVEEGDEVLVPSPGFVSYAPSVKFAGGNPLEYPLLEENNFRPRVEDLQELTSEHAKAIFLNTPSNPTGFLLRKKDLEEIADYLVENSMIALVDEVYEKFIYEGDHISLASLNGIFDKVITINGFSKTYAMTGWRIGYAVAPEEKIDLMVKFQMYTATCPPNFPQKALANVMNSKELEETVGEMVNSYRARRDLIVRRINEMPNIEIKRPEGAFYAFPNIRRTGVDSRKFSKRMIEDAKVVCVPGRAFGKYGEGYIRISYANEYKRIKEAMNRTENLLKKLK